MSQGSELSPILYNIYTADVSGDLCKVFLYAERQSSMKYLGVKKDRHPTWGPHVDEIAKKTRHEWLNYWSFIPPNSLRDIPWFLQVPHTFRFDLRLYSFGAGM